MKSAAKEDFSDGVLLRSMTADGGTVNFSAVLVKF